MLLEEEVALVLVLVLVVDVDDDEGCDDYFDPRVVEHTAFE